MTRDGMRILGGGFITAPTLGFLFRLTLETVRGLNYPHRGNGPGEPIPPPLGR
jgi:hypothetical protein